MLSIADSDLRHPLSQHPFMVGSRIVECEPPDVDCQQFDWPVHPAVARFDEFHIGSSIKAGLACLQKG